MALVLLATLFNCAPFVNRPLLSPQEKRLTVIREVIEKNHALVHSISGHGQVVIESPMQSFSGTATVRVKNPDSVWVKIEAMLGVDIGIISADRKRFTLFSPMENLAYIGANEDTLRLEMFLGFDMPFDQLVQSMSGLAPIAQLDRAIVSEKDEQIVVIGTSGQLIYQYTIEPKYGLVSQLILKAQNGKILRIEEYKRFMRFGKAVVPRMMRFIRPEEKESVTMFYDELQVNKSLSAKDFYIKMPQGVLKVRL
ncbi:MAG: DUF4292 domain-containing protein [Calditrichaeota bacterium]|nr:MAG: DUF4292 domain-containing protein [Calditrichota bacterium]